MHAVGNKSDNIIAYDENFSEKEPPKWLYTIVPETGFNPDLGEYNTYGIKVTGVDCEQILHDVSVCNEAVSEIVRLFNKHRLCPVHLTDAVEDILP